MYLNELTGLCRPEELLRLFRKSTRLAEQTGVPIDSAMISDVPGYTWGTVTAMAQAGIRYFSTAPNYIDRIGDTLVKWENRPFYWVSPSGKDKVLVWIPLKGYALSHIIHELSPGFVTDYLAELEKTRLSLRDRSHPVVRAWRQCLSRSGDLRLRQAVERGARLATVHHRVHQPGVPGLRGALW